MNTLNRCSLKIFIQSGDMSFDEYVVAFRNRMCPVRKCNNDKPDTYRADFSYFLILMITTTKNIDVYQGKNSANVSIDKRAKVLPTTQNVVSNSMYKFQFDISDGSNGYRHFLMDNWYTCPELAMILRNQCNTYLKIQL